MSGKAGARHVALLRGINVGGKNKLPMKTLVAIFEQAGADDVRTYIQSGNVVFTAAAAAARRIAASVERRIAEHPGYRVPVVLRGARELRRAVDANPFDGPDVDPKLLHVGFLRDRPAAAAVRALDPDRSPPDAFRVAGREIYLCLPNGMARTRLTNAWFDARLGTVATFRNWRTALRLTEMAEE